MLVTQTIALRSVKHTEITGKLKVSASKKRKATQQHIKALIEGVLDTATQQALGKDSKRIARINRAAKYKAIHGNIQYLSDGVTIDTALSFN